MVTFEQLVARVQGELDRDPAVREYQTDEVVGRIVRSTIEGLGLHISEATGEVCDPRPKPVVNYPNDQQVRSRGRGKRFGGRR